MNQQTDCNQIRTFLFCQFFFGKGFNRTLNTPEIYDQLKNSSHSSLFNQKYFEKIMFSLSFTGFRTILHIKNEQGQPDGCSCICNLFDCEFVAFDNNLNLVANFDCFAFLFVCCSIAGGARNFCLKQPFNGLFYALNSLSKL